MTIEHLPLSSLQRDLSGYGLELVPDTKLSGNYAWLRSAASQQPLCLIDLDAVFDEQGNYFLDDR